VRARRAPRVADTTVHAAWTVAGHNHGRFRGLPPTGRPVRLQGLDVIEADAGGIRSVFSYFDSAVVPRQLGLDVIVQPRQTGPFAFGTATVMRRRRAARPGLLAVTEMIAAGDAPMQPIRELARTSVMERLGNPAFQGFTSALAGRRMTSILAWASQEALLAATQAGSHSQALQALFRDGIVQSSSSTVYAPLHVGPQWRRCGTCGACVAIARLEDTRSSCHECGSVVEALA